MKFFIITLPIIIILNSNKAISDVLPNDLFSSVEVVELQMNSLQTNSKVNNAGIYQCWLFAHRENKKYGGPLDRFVSMIRSNPYDVLLGSLFFETKLISKNQTEAKVEVFLDGKNKNRYKILWILSRSNVSKNCTNCWMTTGVSQPQNLGPMI
jgi:hypothetical protein